MRELSALPADLSGRYTKRLLDDGQSVWLFKEYPYPSSWLPCSAEVSAAAIYQAFDLEHSVPVAFFSWGDTCGTIQPYLGVPQHPSIEHLLRDEQLASGVRSRQVLDWVLSNHDTHLRHLLIHDAGLFFVDYGQAFKYFPGDVLSASYHPNAHVGQEPPVYNVMRRNHSEPTIPPAVAEMINRVQAADLTVWRDALDPYLQTKHSTQADREAFLRGVEQRIAVLWRDFSAFYGTGPL